MQDFTPPDTVVVKQQLLKQRWEGRGTLSAGGAAGQPLFQAASGQAPIHASCSRSAISEAQQQLDLDAYAGHPLETPMAQVQGAKRGAGAGVAFVGVPDSPAPASRSGGQVVADVLLYTNPPLTYVVAGAGVVLLAAVFYCLRGAHNLTFLTGEAAAAAAAAARSGCQQLSGAAALLVPLLLPERRALYFLSDSANAASLRPGRPCHRASPPRTTAPHQWSPPPSSPAPAVLSYVLLADIALNFLRSLISKQWLEAGSWAGSAWAAALAERAAAGIAALARLHDSFLLCKDPVVTLKVAGGLWGLAILGQYLRWVGGRWWVLGPGAWWVLGAFPTASLPPAARAACPLTAPAHPPIRPPASPCLFACLQHLQPGGAGLCGGIHPARCLLRKPRGGAGVLCQCRHCCQPALGRAGPVPQAEGAGRQQRQRQQQGHLRQGWCRVMPVVPLTGRPASPLTQPLPLLPAPLPCLPCRRWCWRWCWAPCGCAAPGPPALWRCWWGRWRCGAT